mgnify:FL=1
MKYALGIDLGTTNSVMAIVKNSDQKPEIIPMGANDQSLLQSALYFSDINGKSRVFFGSSAVNRGLNSGIIDYFKQDFKRDIARDVESEAPNHVRVNSVILSALILNEFKKRSDIVSMELGVSPIHDAVITVPAYFTSEQRRATKNAGRLAGLNILRIINEPTAAAISYAHEKGISGKVLVYDLGGGTFDVTVMDVDNHHYNILATDGNHRLGGIDFDKRLVKFIESKLEEQGLNMTMLSAKEKLQLRYQAEKIKIALSVDEVAFYETYTDQGAFGVEITREEFRQQIADLLKDTMIKVQSTMSAAKISWDELDHILLVRGSTRMPLVREAIEAMSGQHPTYSINPDTIVAEGASIIANLIANDAVSFEEEQDGQSTATQSGKMVIRDITSQGLGMLLKKSPQKEYPFVGDFFNKVVVARNTPIPTLKNYDIYAVADGQDTFRVRITEGNYENPLSVKPILEIREQLAVPRRKDEKIAQIRFAFDTEQMVHIGVFDGLTGQMINRYRINTEVDSESYFVEDDLSDLKVVYDKFVQ